MDQVVDSEPAADSGITQLLHQWSDGRDDAFRELLSVAYTRLRSIAGACMSGERPDHTLQPTALVGELYLRLAGAKLSDWKDREHFYSFASERCAGSSRTTPGRAFGKSAGSDGCCPLRQTSGGSASGKKMPSIWTARCRGAEKK